MEEKILQDILETVQFLKDNMMSKTEGATKLDLERFATKEYISEHFATKDDLYNLKNDLMNHMDGFIGLHQKLDMELISLRSKYDRLESYIKQLANHAHLQLQ